MSCLFASRRSGTPRICGAERTASKVRVGISALGKGGEQETGRARGVKKERTKGFPALAEALVVDCIDDVDDGVAVIVVFWPYGPDPALASEIPELEHGRGQSYLSGCTERRKVI